MTDQKKILVFNWRDIKNPAAGGAEKYIHEIFKRLSESGHDITLFTSAFKNCRDEEILDGIKIIRKGNKYSVYCLARRYYQKYLSRNDYDLIVDSINTVPFFTPDFIKDKKIISIIYQLAREFWFYETKFPINYLGRYFLENRWLKRYSGIPVITISNSTRKDLASLGFKKIFNVPVGITSKPVSRIKTRKKNILLFIGRLTEAKKPFDIIKAFSLAGEVFPDIELLIMGRGYLEDRLKSYCRTLDCSPKIRFTGFLPEDEKQRIIEDSKLLLVAGIREGWGMVVTEANASGVSAIGYDIQGLRDSIIDGRTGLLSSPDPYSMSRRIIEFLKDDSLQDRLSRRALEYSRQFSWDDSTRKFKEVIENI